MIIFVTHKKMNVMSLNNFAAIDFETANMKRYSVCSVGIVLVNDGVITDEIYQLIKPRPNFYSSFNTKVHGLNFEDTIDAPEFPSVWSEIHHKIEGLPLIAHNSPFDESCLKAVHELYNMNYPDYTFYCTCKAARKKFPFLPNHRLNTVSEYCGYDLKNHHHALADAIAAANIALKVF